MVELVTGEFTNHPDKALIDEYNQIQIEVAKNGLFRYSKQEIISKHERVMQLKEILVVEQLSLF